MSYLAFSILWEKSQRTRGKYIILNIGKNQLIFVTNVKEGAKYMVSQSGKTVSLTTSSENCPVTLVVDLMVSFWT